MAVIQIKRGLQEAVTNLVLAQGELAVALDTGNVYIGATSGNVHINPKGGKAVHPTCVLCLRRCQRPCGTV